MRDTAEYWAPVRDFDDLYEVSSLGRVRRIGRAHRTGKGRGGGVVIGRVLRDQHINGGYRIVQLWREGQPFSMLVHRLVAIAFLPRADLNMQVNHKSGNKLDNSVSNLEWLTASENMYACYATGIRVVTDAQRSALLKRVKLGTINV